MTIDMKIVSRKVTNNYKHKRCKIKITKIKIIMTRNVANSCSQVGGKRR